MDSLKSLILSVTDPISGQSLETLGATVIEEGERCVLRLPYPADPSLYKERLATVLGDQPFELEVRVPRFAVQEGVEGLPSIKNLIVVGSGKGGVGKSTVAVNLALALKEQGAAVGLLDADIYGPSVPRMLGLVHAQAPVSENRLTPVEAHGVPSMSIGYLVDESMPMAWRGPMISGALTQLVKDTIWPSLDYLIVDLPPGTGDIQLTLSQKMPVAGAVIVTTPQQVACADAQKSVAMFEKVNVPLLGIVENMAAYHCENCGHANALFGSGGAQSLADKASIPLLGSIPFAAKIAENADAGLSSVSTVDAYTKVAQQMVRQLALRPRDRSLTIRKTVTS